MTKKYVYVDQVKSIRIAVVEDEAVFVVGPDDQLELIPQRRPVTEAGVAKVRRGQLVSALERRNLEKIKSIKL